MTRKEQIRRRKKIRRLRRILRANMPKLLLAAGLIIIITSTAIFKAQDKSEATEQPETTTVMATTEAVMEENTEPKVQKFQDTHSMDWDGEESYLLAKIAMAEAESESTEGKAMVIMVVLNRVFDPSFPGTIEEVIFQEKQFAPIWDGRWDEVEPDEDCWKALDLIMLDKWDESEGATYFEATYNGDDTWHSRNLVYIKTVGNHNFYKEAAE